MLQGKTKTEYQKQYMRQRRSNKGLTHRSNSIGSNKAGSNIGLTVELDTVKAMLQAKPATQSVNPMMIGYVPPK